MKTIKYYTDNGRYIGWKKFKSFCDNWLECKSWLNSGNSLIINEDRVGKYELGKLKLILSKVEV